MQDAGTVLEVLRDHGRKGPELRRERGTVTGEPSALKGAHWVRREAARKRPAPHTGTGPRRAAHPVTELNDAGAVIMAGASCPGHACQRHETNAAPDEFGCHTWLPTEATG
jgi:hypothetical protein